MTASRLQPLAGLTVWVTRPDGQGEGLAALIAEEGGRAILAPLLSIEPTAEPARAVALLSQPEPWDWLIFISVNAVRHALSLPGWAQGLTGRTRVAAVGEATAAELERAGLHVALLPLASFNSEGLLADPRMARVAGQRVLIVRGEGGREHLAEVLRERGADVAHAEVYRRRPVSAEAFAPGLTEWADNGGEVVIVTSGEALSRLTELLESAGLEARPPLIVPGERLARLARDQGWARVIMAEQAADEAILQSVKQWAHARRTGLGPLAALLAEPAPPPVKRVAPDPGAATMEASDRRRNTNSHTENESVHLGDTPLTDKPIDIQSIATSEEDRASVTDTTDTSDANAAPSGDKKPAPKRRGLAWMGYLILIGVVALAVGGWFLLQELRSRQEGLGGQLTDKSLQVQEVAHQLNALQSEITALHSQLATLQSQFSGSEARVDHLLGEQGEQVDTKLETTRGELAMQIQQIQRQLNRTRGDVLIADAEYLLNIANQKLNLVGDVKSVLAAMQAADQRLHESGDPAVFKVRETLAGEMSALRKVQAPDLVGISSRLIVLEQKVDALPLVLPHAGIVKQHEMRQSQEQAAPSPEEEEGDAIDQALSGIKDLVTVRRTDRPVEAVLAPQQVEALRELLLMKLEAARAALLRNNEQLYRDSLKAAGDWVGQHFDTNAGDTQAMLDELRQLAEQAFSIAYPDISKSMVMLQNIEKLRLETEDAAIHGAGGKAPAPAGADPGLPAPDAASGEGKKKDKAKGGKSDGQPPVTVPGPSQPGGGSTEMPAAPEAKPAETSGERL